MCKSIKNNLRQSLLLALNTKDITQKKNQKKAILGSACRKQKAGDKKMLLPFPVFVVLVTHLCGKQQYQNFAGYFVLSY